MTDKNVKLVDKDGNFLYPQTKGALVKNNSGNHLGTVEAGAQVNKIEEIVVNGTALTINNKSVTIPEIATYSVVKQATAESGYSATYYLTKDGTQIGDKINIAKDMVVQSGSVKTVTTANSPVNGYRVGDKYIDLVLANASNSHIYILVSDLVDTYTQGNGITITNKQVSVDTNYLSGIYAQTTNVNTALGNKADKSDTYTKTEVNTMVGAKADSSTTLAGYGISNAYTKGEVDGLISGFISYEVIP